MTTLTQTFYNSHKKNMKHKSKLQPSQLRLTEERGEAFHSMWYETCEYNYWLVEIEIFFSILKITRSEVTNTINPWAFHEKLM